MGHTSGNPTDSRHALCRRDLPRQLLGASARIKKPTSGFVERRHDAVEFAFTRDG
jgi:hypothetical protein